MKSNKEFNKLNPFPGLRPFSPEESDVFFGREKESEEVLGKLLKNRFVTVTGASGSGKSSLVYCGLLPKIREMGRKESSPWRIIIFRPGNDPFGNLGKAIHRNIAETGLKEVAIETLLLDLRRESDGISTALKKHIIRGYEKVLLVVDQFEEIFRFRTSDAGGSGRMYTGEFIENLVNAVSLSDSRIFTVVTMRADFMGECAYYQGLTQLINNSNFLVPRMDRENYRHVIEGPVKYAGAAIDPSFVEALLDDIGDQTDQLPVLQHALMRTWAHWQELNEPERPISYIDYDSVGTMSNAMSRHANEAYGELDPKGMEICKKMFKAITEKGPDNKGIRHPSGVYTLMSIIECKAEELYNVIDKFRIPSRSFITPRHGIQLNDESVIDLSHESLIRLWDRLSEWVDEEAASIQMYKKLSEASAMYQQGKTGLMRPPDLQLAVNWRDRQKPTLNWARRYYPAFERAMVYLRTSEKEYLEEEERKLRLQKKKMKRSRVISIIFGGAALIAFGLMISAFIQKVSADRQTTEAETKRVLAEKEKNRADSITAVAILKQQMADSGTIAARKNEAEALRQKEIAQFQQIVAERNAAELKRLGQLALLRSDSAQRISILADQIVTAATEEKNTAVRLRMLSTGKSMSLKSLQLEGEKDLQTLLAYQAYMFYKNNGGYENDADIYNGLYNVIKKYGSGIYNTFNGHTGEIKSIAFAPGGKEFYTSGVEGQVLKWNHDDNTSKYQVVYTGKQIIEVLAASPDGTWLAAGESNSSIHMIPLRANYVKYALTGHTDRINSLIFSSDSKFLYSASLDGKVLKWDLDAKTCINLAKEENIITSIDISSDGKYLAGISNNGNVFVWDPATGSDYFRIETQQKNNNVIRFKPDDTILAIGNVDGNVELWDLGTREKISEVRAHTAQVNDIEFNRILGQMATAGNDKRIKIYNIRNINDLTLPPVTLSDNEGVVVEIQFSPDGQYIVSGTNEGSQNLVSRAVNADNLVKDICSLVTRNMTQVEWDAYVGKDIPLEKTCRDSVFKIKVKEVK